MRNLKKSIWTGKDKNSANQSQWQAFTYVSGIGVQAVAMIGICLYLGRLADTYLQSGHIGTVVGIIVGFATSVWSVYNQLIKR